MRSIISTSYNCTSIYSPIYIYPSIRVSISIYAHPIWGRSFRPTITVHLCTVLYPSTHPYVYIYLYMLTWDEVEHLDHLDLDIYMVINQYVDLYVYLYRRMLGLARCMSVSRYAHPRWGRNIYIDHIPIDICLWFIAIDVHLRWGRASWPSARR